MASGTIWGVGNHPSGQIHARIDWWTSGQDVAANTSVVNATLYVARVADGYSTWGTGTFGLDIADAGAVHDTKILNLRDGVWHPVVSLARTVPHNPDGSQAVWIRGSGGMPEVGWTATDVAGVATLDTIPRASQPTLSAATFDAGTPVTIHTNRASASFTHTVRAAWGARSQTFQNVGASVVWTMPLEWFDQAPNATSTQGTIFVDTFAGGTHVGTRHVIFTARLPAAVVPTISGVTLTDLGPGQAKTGALVAGVSQAQVVVSGSGVHGSVIVAASTSLAGSTITGDTGTHPVTGAGSQTYRGTLTDSRGRTASQSETVTVLPYAPPTVSTLLAWRVRPDGTADPLGTQIRVSSGGSVASLVNGGQKNTLTWVLAWRQRGAATWTTVKTVTAPPGTLSWSDVATIPDASVASSWEVQVTVTDAFGSVVASQTVPTGQVAMSWSRTGVGVGKIWERGALDVEGEVYQHGRTLSELYGPGRVLYDSPSAGVVITTDIPASEDLMWMLDVRLNSYLAGQGTGVLWAQGYQYAAGNSIIATAATATFAVGQLEAYNANGVLCWWLPIVGYAQTVAVNLAGTSGSLNHRVVSVAAGARPAGRSRPTLITPQVLGDGVGLPIGQAYVSALGANVNVGPGQTVTGLTQTVTVTAGHHYEVMAHLDLTVAAGSLAVFELAIAGAAQPGQLISSVTGRQPATRTWRFVAVSSGATAFALRTTGVSSPSGVGLTALHTTLTITRTR